MTMDRPYSIAVSIYGVHFMKKANTSIFLVTKIFYRSMFLDIQKHIQISGSTVICISCKHYDLKCLNCIYKKNAVIKIVKINFSINQKIHMLYGIYKREYKVDQQFSMPSNHDPVICMFHCLFIVLEIPLFSMSSSHDSEIRMFHCLFTVLKIPLFSMPSGHDPVI